MGDCPPNPRGVRIVGLVALLVCALLPLRSSLATTPPGRASTTQDSEQLTLESAPVTIVAPAGRGQWTRRLAAFADAAAQAYTEILGAPPPPGTLRWAPDPMTATEIDARVTLEMGPQGASITFDDPFDIIAEDLGVAFAQGYARWLAAYSVARLYFTGTDEPGSWWIDGASLYMTELMARRERSTTPILYNIEGAYDRAARAGRPVPLGMEQDAGAGDAVRGKSLATFRLLAATYGEQAVAGLLAAIAAAPAGQGLREIAVASLPANLLPSPAELLGTWLEPTAAIDLGITDVRVGEGGSTIRGRVTRAGPVPVATRVEVRLATGELVYADIPASSESENWQLDVDAPPVDVRLDPDSLLPDVNRSNNRYGFGSAERIREFFPLDDLIDIGELHFDGTIEQVGRKRVENFSVTLENKTEEPVGLGVLVSAQWIDRPAARTQRRVFVMLPPGQRVVAHDFVEYPRRGTGAARIEARYWRAPDPDTLTERSMRDPADLLNSYVLIRQPAEATGAEGSPLERLQEEQTVSSVAELTVAGGGEPTFGGDAGETPPPPGVEAAGTDASVPFAVRIISPTANATPLGEMTFSVAVDGPEALLLELYVNDEIVGRGAGNAARATFTASEEENIYVLRAVAVGASGELVTDTRVLQRGAIGFTTSVDLVTLNVTVRQPGGGLVEGLNADDFVVVEDGVEQEIVNFSRGEDTAVFAAMLLDTSSSMIGGGINSARAGANRLIDALLRGNDRAMVLGFNDRLYLYSDFSGDIPALRAAIEATRPDGSTALYDAMVGALRKVNRRTGRRALIVLSDGLDVGSEFNFEDVLEYTRQSDVLVYTIGLQLMHDATDLGDASDVVRRSVENLQALAEATGGSSYFPLRLDELQEVYAEIAAELESQYSLSYYPSNQQWNGRWRELSVRLTSGAGGVQARPGYYGIRPSERQNP